MRVCIRLCGGVIALALLAGCSGGGGTHRRAAGAAPVVTAAAPGRCPARVTAASYLARGEPAAVPAGAVSIQACGYVRGGPLRGEPPLGVALNARAATALADLIAQLPVRREPPCRSSGIAGLLRFQYDDEPSVEAYWTSATSGCSGGRIYLDGVVHAVPEPVVGMLASISASYGKGAGGSAPDVTGLSATAAQRRARAAHYAADFGGEVVDPDRPAGTVLLQSPPAGAGEIGRQIDMVVSVSPTGNCRPAQLRLQYAGGEEGAGNVFGTVEIRDVSDRPCRLRGPIGVTGLDPSGHVIHLDRPIRPAALHQAAVLSATTPPLPVGREPGPTEVIVDVELMGEYRDGPGPSALCPKRDETVPASWRLTINHHDMTVPNRGTRGGEQAVEGCLGAISSGGARVT